VQSQVRQALGCLATTLGTSCPAEAVSAPLAVIPIVPSRWGVTAAPPFAVTWRVAYQGQQTSVSIKPGEGVEVSGVPVGTRFEVKASAAGGGTFSYLAYVRRSASSAVTLMASGSQVTWPVAGAAFEANK